MQPASVSLSTGESLHVSLCLRLVYLYENLVPRLGEAFRERAWESAALRALLRGKVQRAQACALRIFRHVVFSAFLRPVLEDR